MKVCELIDILKSYDPEMMVVVKGYEAGYNEADRAVEIKLCLDYHREWYYGKHEYVFDKDEASQYKQACAVYLIGRENR